MHPHGTQSGSARRTMKTLTGLLAGRCVAIALLALPSVGNGANTCVPPATRRRPSTPRPSPPAGGEQDAEQGGTSTTALAGEGRSARQRKRCRRLEGAAGRSGRPPPRTAPKPVACRRSPPRTRGQGRGDGSASGRGGRLQARREEQPASSRSGRPGSRRRAAAEPAPRPAAPPALGEVLGAGDRLLLVGQMGLLLPLLIVGRDRLVARLPAAAAETTA